MNATDQLYRLFIFGAPAVFAAVLHMIAVKHNWFAFLKIPLDLKHTFNGKRIFGENKTFRGIVVMVLFSIMSCYLLGIIIRLYPELGIYNPFYFELYSPAFYGLLFGLGYTIPELPNSFYKRQIDIPPGETGSLMNLLIDQLDSVIGCFLLLYPFVRISPSLVLFGVIFYLGVHLTVNILLYSIGIRRQPL